MYNWNPVFNLMIEIKKEYMNRFGEISYGKIMDKNGKQITCIENWISMLNIQKYKDIFKYLQVNQKNNMLLVRYGNYADVFGGEDEITNDTFWYMYDGIYNECRSLTVDIKDEFIVLSPFRKFRNVNETEENSWGNILEEIKNAESVEITNKLDGSLQPARYVPQYGKIVMSGSQAIDETQSWRLEDGYNRLNENYVKMLTENEDYTFMFEYISLRDAHVVCYTEKQEGLYLIGIRNVKTGEQLSYAKVIAMANKYDVLTTEIFNKTLDEVLYDVKNCKSNEKEGFVISIDGRLVKLKVDDYVEIHKVLSKISSINLIVKYVAEDKYDDLIAKVPQAYRWRIDKIANIVFSYIRDMDKNVNYFYDKAPKGDVKTFMIWVNKNVDKKYCGYVKAMYNNRPINYVKKGNGDSAGYKKLNEMIVVQNYNELFEEG